MPKPVVIRRTTRRICHVVTVNGYFSMIVLWDIQMRANDGPNLLECKMQMHCYKKVFPNLLFTSKICTAWSLGQKLCLIVLLSSHCSQNIVLHLNVLRSLESNFAYLFPGNRLVEKFFCSVPTFFSNLVLCYCRRAFQLNIWELVLHAHLWQTLKTVSSELGCHNNLCFLQWTLTDFR